MMLHAARPLPPWLICDVRQKIQRTKTGVWSHFRRCGSSVSERWSCRRERVPGTRVTRSGKFQTVGTRRSGVHALTRVLPSHVRWTPRVTRSRHSVCESSPPPSSFIALMIQVAAPPNKTPEPTACSVTPRAIEGKAEMKPQNANRFAARVAPEQAVAHL